VFYDGGRGPRCPNRRERPTGPLARRFARICRRIQSTAKPIVWLRAMPGTGKTRLLLDIERGAAALNFERWSFLDDPAPQALRTGIAELGLSAARGGVSWWRRAASPTRRMRC